MFARLSIFTAVLAIASVSATPVDLSNAERLQQGLPLRSPSKRYVPTKTRNLHPRASNEASAPQVVQVNPIGGTRKRAAPQYLTYDQTSGKIKIGASRDDLTDALQMFLPPEGQVHGPLNAEFNEEILYVDSASDDQAVFTFGLTSSSDYGLPIGKSSQTSIWSYASAVLSVDYFHANSIAQALALGTDAEDNLIGATDPSSLRVQLGLGVVSLADAQADQSERNTWYMKVIDSSNTTPGVRYAVYNDAFDSFDLVTNQADATIFSIDQAPSNASRVMISFEMNGSTELVGLKETAKQYGAYDSPTVSMIRKGGGTELNPYLTEPVVTEGWTLRSYVTGYPGLLGHYTWNDGRQADVVFTATTHSIGGRALNRYGVGQPAVITFVAA